MDSDASGAATLPDMSVVKINAIEVPEGMGAELEKRFGARVGEVEKMPGFEGFELLRPTGRRDALLRVHALGVGGGLPELGVELSVHSWSRRGGSAKAVRPSHTVLHCSSSR